MTDDEMFGKMMGQVATLIESHERLCNEVLKLRWRVNKLPCMAESGEDTDPDCPALLSDRPHRPTLHSVSEDEPDSVVRAPTSVGAGPIHIRGPAIMVAAIVAIVVMGLAVTPLRHLVAAALRWI